MSAASGQGESRVSTLEFFFHLVFVVVVLAAGLGPAVRSIREPLPVDPAVLLTAGTAPRRSRSGC